MFKSLTLAGAALAMSAVAMAPTAADAQRYYGDRYERAYDARAYDGYRAAPRYDRRAYRQNYRRCDSGAGGAIVGAIAGGLLGNTIAGRGRRRPCGARDRSFGQSAPLPLIRIPAAGVSGGRRSPSRSV